MRQTQDGSHIVFASTEKQTKTFAKKNLWIIKGEHSIADQGIQFKDKLQKVRHNTREKIITFCLAGECVVEMEDYSITQNLSSVITKVSSTEVSVDSFNFTQPSGHNTFRNGKPHF